MINKPLKIKNKIIKNRIIIPPMASRSASSDGFVTDKTLEYYKNINKNKSCGMVIVEHCYCHISGKAHPFQLGCDNIDKFEGLKKVSDIIKQYDALSILQISHAGQVTTSEVTNQKTYSVSQVPFRNRPTGDMLITKDILDEIIESFVSSAYFAYQNGFDGVEIHSAHGYLLNQLYSPYSNKRTDELGGNLENRIYAHLEIVKRIRKLVSDDFLILIRFGAYDYFDDTLSSESDYINASIKFEEAGYDIIDVSGGLSGYIVTSRLDQEGYFSDVTNTIKKHVNIPVVLTGGIKTKSACLNHLENNNCDLIGIGRMILNDNDYVKNNFNN